MEREIIIIIIIIIITIIMIILIIIIKLYFKRPLVWHVNLPRGPQIETCQAECLVLHRRYLTLLRTIQLYNVEAYVLCIMYYVITA